MSGRLFYGCAALVILAAVAVQAPAVGYKLVWDDLSNVQVDQASGCPQSLIRCFTRTPRELYYRPVFSASLAPAVRLVGDQPPRLARWLHVENLVFFGLELCLALGFFLALFGTHDERPILATALLGLHPLQAGSVTWVTGRAETLPAIGLLAAALLLARSGTASRPALLRALALAAFAAALFAKEQAAPFVLLVPLLLPVLRPRARWAWTAAFGLVVLGFAAATFAVLSHGAVLRSPWTAGEHLLVVARTVAHAVKSLAWPHDAVLHQMTISPWNGAPPGDLALAAAAAALWIAIGVVGRRHPVARVCWGWTTLTLLPVLNIAPMNLALGSYRLVLPLVGLSGLAATGVGILAARAPGRARLVYGAAAAIAILLGVQTARHAPAWSSELRFLQARLEADPTAADPLTVGGGKLYLAGRLDEARNFFDAAVELYFPGAGTPAERLAQAAAGTTQRRVMETNGLRAASTWRPKVAAVLYPRAAIAKTQGRLGDAADDLEVAVAIAPVAERGEELGRLLLTLGRPRDARRVLERLVADAPTPARQQLLDTARASAP